MGSKHSKKQNSTSSNKNTGGATTAANKNTIESNTNNSNVILLPVTVGDSSLIVDVQQQQPIYSNTTDIIIEPSITATNSIVVDVTNNQKISVVNLQQVQGGAYVGGISLKYLEELISNNTDQLPPNATMTDLVRDVIKPATSTKKESYLQKLAREQPDKVKSTADHFVSYVWSYQLVDELLASLKYTLLDKTNQEDVFIWLDGFCVNQHQVSNGVAVTPEQLQLTFGESLKAIGSVVMVLVNWRDPSYAKRIWCVFEAYMAKKSNTKVILAMSSSEEKSLVETMIANDITTGFLASLFGNVDVESAQAKEPQDQQAILQLIKQYGVADVNAVILNNLKQWMVHGGDVALKTVGENSIEGSSICNFRHIIHRLLGEFDTSLEWAEKTLNISIKIYGPEHENVAVSYDNLSACFKDLGRLNEALVANEHDWAICSKILGMDDPDTISCLSKKATILQGLGKLKEALLVRDEVLQTSRRVLGEDDDDTTLAKLKKADCLRQLKQFDEALVLFDEVVEATKRYLVQYQLGDNQPALADRLHDKAQCWEEMGRPEEALILCDQALGIYMKTLGVNSLQVANCTLTKAKCLDNLQRSEEALDLLNQSLEIRTKIYHGLEHINVAEVLHYKGLCLKHLGQQQQADELGKQSLGIYERKLGMNHPVTVEVRNVWVGL
jgi:tetratricopeptide (TPR) repeat protein